MLCHFEPSSPFYGQFGGQKQPFLGCFEAVFRTIILKVQDDHQCVNQVSQIQQYQDLQLGPSWVLVLVNALEITVEQSPLALQTFLHGHEDRPETWLKTACFHLEIAHPVAPRHGTRLIPHPFAFL